MVAISAPFALAGRSTATNPHLQNATGNNSLDGTISLVEGGDQYVIQSDSGDGNSLTITGAIQNDTISTYSTARNLVLQGGGVGEVKTNGITNGGSNPAPINVIKSGLGIWTISDVNTYNGNTMVNAGILKIGASGTIANTPLIMIASAGTLDVASVGGGFQIVSGQQLAGLGNVTGGVSDSTSGGAQIVPGYIDPITSVNTPGKLTSSGNLKLNNATSTTLDVLKFDLAKTTGGLSDWVTVGSHFYANGAKKVEIEISLLQPTIDNGTYPLIKYVDYTVGGGDHPIANLIRTGASPGRQILSLFDNTGLKEIELLVTGGAAMNLTWVGHGDALHVLNDWDINTTKNWTGSGPQWYFDGDMVSFTDTGSNSPDIKLTAKLSPGSVTFSNSLQNYTLSGTGYLSGSTGLTLNGTGKVTFANTVANDFTGAITITSGTLQIGNGTNSSGIASTAITDNGALIIDPASTATITMANVISGTGSFAKTGAATLNLSSITSSYTGVTTISGGTLNATLIAAGGSNSSIGASTSIAANLVIDGGTLQYTGAAAVASDRLFTMGASGATIDASGTGRVSFSNTGAIAFTGSGDRTLTLAGSNATGETTGTNVIWAVIGKVTGYTTSVYKTGAGRWTLSNNNTYSGTTTVDNGILWAYNQSPGGSGNGIPQTYLYNTALGDSANSVTVNSGGVLGIWGNAYATWTTTQASVTLKGGTIMADDGHQTLNAPVNFTTDSSIICRYNDKDFLINGPLTGTGNLSINPTLPGSLPMYSYNLGAVILTGSGNTWTGTTTIGGSTSTITASHSTLQIGNAGVGSLPIGAANAITLPTGAYLNFNTTNDITITDATINGAGTISNFGSGTIILNDDNKTGSANFTGYLVVGAGGGVTGLQYTAIGLTTNPALNNGALRVENSNVWYSSSGTYYVAIAGGNSLSRLELGGGATDVTTPTTLCWLNGRNPDITAPILVSVSRNNTIAGTVELGSSGNTYIIESKNAGDTLTFNATNAIGNDNNNTTARYLTLKGAGNFTVNGIVGGDATYPTRTNVVLNKSGGGTLTLNGVNTYTGNTTINGGTLALGSLPTSPTDPTPIPATIAGSPVIAVNLGAAFDVRGTTTGGMTLGAAQTISGSGTVKGNITTTASGSTVSPGGSIGTLTFNDSLTMAGKDNINYEVSGAGDDLITVLGTMTLPGDSALATATNINFGVWGSEPAAGAGTLHQVAGAATLTVVAAIPNNSVTVVNPTRYAVNAIVTAGTPGRIDVNVAGSNSTLTWAGTGASVWDVITTNPWSGGGPSPDGLILNDNRFYQADRVIFDNSCTQVAVGIPVTVKPLSVTVSGSQAYAFTGVGKISGSTGFAMNGTGTVTLGTTNDYYGDTTVTAGTLTITGGIGPKSKLYINSGATVKLSNVLALGDNSQFMTAPTYIVDGTLDINGVAESLSVQNEIVNVRGNGVSNVGAIINSSGGARTAFHFVNMTGDTYFGGTGANRWEIGRWTTGGAPVGYLNGNNKILTKVGTNDVWLNNLGSVDLKGLVINAGELTIEWDNSLIGTVLIDSSTSGSGPGGYAYTPITVNAGGMFGMWGRPTAGSNTPLNVVGAGPVLYSNVTLKGGGIGGTQVDTQAAQTYAGTITLDTGGLIYAATPSNTSQKSTDTYFTGKITGNGNLTKPATFTVGTTTVQDNGKIYFTGSVANDYVGTTTINNGWLVLGKNAGVTAVPGDINLGTTTTSPVLSLAASNQIADTAIVTMTGASGNQAYLDLMGFNETVGGISDSSGNGVIELYYYGSANNSTFTVKTAASTSYSFNGIMCDKATGTPTGTLSLVKDGPGTQILTGSNITYTGNTTVLGGILDVPNLNTPNSDVTVAAGSNVLIATSIVSKTLTIGAGGEVIIRAISGGPTSGSGSSLAPVPEPATWAMLMLAAMGLGIYWRRRR